MSPQTVGVLALQGDVREHLGALTAAGVDAITVRRPSELEAVDGLVLPGGESTTMIKLIETFELLDLVRKRIADGLPTYGSCAGMILLADRLVDGIVGQQTLGGLDITVRRNAFGRQVDSFEADVAIEGIAGGLVHAVFIRAPWVEDVGPAAQALAQIESGPAAGRVVVVRQQHLLATSFHPELTGDGRVHEYFAQMVRGTDEHPIGFGLYQPDPVNFGQKLCGGSGVSGHSKWATTKHKKAVIDAKRGKLFAKLIKNIEVSARVGGGDPDGNPTLYDAIQKARKNSVPVDNIDRALKRGSGAETGGADWQTITYEGYGPNGVALLIECLTDNRNRAATDVRTAMSRNGGSMADPGSVSYLFSRKGVVIVPKNRISEDDVLGAVLDAGAEEVNDLGEAFEVVSEPTDLVAVRTALQTAGIDYESADQAFLPSLQVPLEADAARKVLKLVDALEDLDDVQNVYANFDVTDEVLESIGAD